MQIYESEVNLLRSDKVSLKNLNSTDALIDQVDEFESLDAFDMTICECLKHSTNQVNDFCKS